MPQHLISLFMWGYQPHFRISLEVAAKSALEELGTEAELEVLLVGMRKPGCTNPNQVCVEPEDGKWPLSIFDGLPASVEEAISEHPLQNMFYGDRASMDEKPENIRRGSVTKSVRRALKDYDLAHQVRSFCGTATLVDDYYVVPVIQVPNVVFKQFPSITVNTRFGREARKRKLSLVHSVMRTLLNQASLELNLPNPGRSIDVDRRPAGEIIRSAAQDLMYGAQSAIGDGFAYTDLFARFNEISSLMYEGGQGTGYMVLGSPDDPRIEYILRLRSPVPFREHRWARKILEMAVNDAALIADGECIYGLGRLRDAGAEDHDRAIFVISFLDHYHWELRCQRLALIRSQYGLPKLPQEPVSKDLFISNYLRVFCERSNEDAEIIWSLFLAATQLNHGSMIVIAEDAEAEAQRLTQQGTGIEPTDLTEELLRCVSGIDGTIILDPRGVCHAVGVILDGPATSACTPSRGSRYNSGLRYVSASGTRRLALVVSEDRTVDIIPKMRPQMSLAIIDGNIDAIEKATLENYHKPRKWLDEHRFYLSAKQCDRVNAAFDRIEDLPKEVGRIVILTARLRPHPEMDESYLIP